MSKLKILLTDAEVNHLRHLVRWVRSEIGQSPDEYVAMVKKLAPALGDVGLSGLSD